jgi:hypothetical protein
MEPALLSFGEVVGEVLAVTVRDVIQNMTSEHKTTLIVYWHYR